MARIRSLKPEFWSDEKVGPLRPIDRLVFLGLISHADDAGRLIDNPKMIDAAVFPLTNDSAAESLDILARLSRVIRYKDESGQSYLQIRHWVDHQKVDHPSKFVFPAPSADDCAKPSRDIPESLATRSPIPDQGPPTVQQKDLSRSALPKPDPVAEVVAYYVSLHPRARPGVKEKGLITKRLAEGYTVADICDGIDGCHSTPHNLGVNDRNRKYLNLELIVRDSTKLHQFIEAKGDAGATMLGERLSKTKLNMERWLGRDGGDDGQARISGGDGVSGGGVPEGAPGGNDRSLLASPPGSEP